MNRIRGTSAITAIIILFHAIGCSKKVTKVESPLPPPPQPRVQEEPPREDFTARDIEAELRPLLQPIYFDFDRAVLRPDGIAVLEKLAPFLSQNPSVRLLAEGHCDERGSSEYNMGLGHERAASVQRWLANYGISSSRIETTSYGKERPVMANCQNEQCHSRNRRVEWKIIGK